MNLSKYHRIYHNQDVCGGIVCRAKPGPGVTGCIIFSTPRMDGTDCGNRKVSPLN